MSTLLHFILFADDTNVFLHDKSYANLFEVMETELVKVAKWFRVNKLSLNLSKTNFILFHTKNKSVPNNYTLSIDGIEIAQADKVKFLGVMIDKKLDWKNQIIYTSNKLAKSIGIIGKVKKYLTIPLLLNLYYAFSYPYLIYCNMIWASNYPSSLDKIRVLQKRLLRLVTFSEPRTPSAPLFKKLKVLNIEQICSYQTGIFMYKYCKDLLPQVFDNMFSFNNSIHSHFTRQSDLLHHFPIKTNVARFSVMYHGSTIWNSIPQYLKELNFLTFKKQYRYFLLQF